MLARLCIALALLLASRIAPADAAHRPVCRTGGGAAPVAAPASVLLVPLLKGSPEDGEPETWPNLPAARLAQFYRDRFRAKTARLPGVRTWNGFLDKAGRLAARGETFDRIVLIGHGGLDGPVLDADLIVMERTEQGAEGRAVRVLEAQPGLADELTITYDAAHNPAFVEGLARHWDKLARKGEDEANRKLTELEVAIEPPDAACLAHHCPAAWLDPLGPADRARKRRVCEWVCRRPLYQSRWEERADPGRFAGYADRLAALANPGALIVVGSCNPGTWIAPDSDPWVAGGLLIRTGMAGGPHPTYLHLLAAATGRSVAGPVGKASAADIVERIKGFETGAPPRHFRVVAPPANCPPES